MEKSKFANLINKFVSLAKKDEWRPVYDKDLDYFYWTRPKFSPDCQSIKVSHETSIYINPKNRNIEGLMVEYLEQNFLEHNPDVKDITKFFTERIGDSEVTIPKSKIEEAGPLLSILASSLRADIYQDNLEKRLTMNDLDNLIDSAISPKK